MSQPLGLTTIEDGDDFYPGDEELSQMDFSGVNNLNNSELSSSPPLLLTITPLVSNGDSQNHSAKLSALDHAHSKFSLRYATTGVVARSCAQHQFVERGLQMGEG
jgi:hypothetical protein